jgi:hypothetical protein
MKSYKEEIETTKMSYRERKKVYENTRLSEIGIEIIEIACLDCFQYAQTIIKMTLVGPTVGQVFRQLETYSDK